VSEGALYCYGVVRAGAAVPSGTAVVEPAAGDLRRLDRGPAAVLASGFGDRRVRTTRGNLDAHQQVVEAAMKAGVVLPFRFGIVVDDVGEVEHRLLGDGKRLERLLDRFEGLVELRVTARYRGDAALREVVESSPRIRRLRSQVDRRPGAAGYYDRITLGEEVAGGLERLRARDAGRLSTRLRQAAKAERMLRRDGEDTVLRAAYLVPRGRVQDFERALASGAGDGERLELTVVGPLEPWDFVEAAA
jgi:hypothetical protein